MLRVLLVTLLAMTLHGYQSVHLGQIERLYGPSPRDLGLYLVRVAPSVPGPRTRRRWVRTGELGRALFAAPASCPACRETPGVLWPVNGAEVQCCDGCAPTHWSDDDAVHALRTQLPWLAVAWQPTEDEDGQVHDPAVGVWVIDIGRTVVPADAPPWARGVIQAMGADDSFQCIDPECPGAGTYHDHPTVTITLRRDDWDLFRETLENDALSTAFDSELREALTAALRRTEEHD